MNVYSFLSNEAAFLACSREEKVFQFSKIVLRVIKVHRSRVGARYVKYMCTVAHSHSRYLVFHIHTHIYFDVVIVHLTVFLCVCVRTNCTCDLHAIFV